MPNLKKCLAQQCAKHFSHSMDGRHQFTTNHTSEQFLIIIILNFFIKFPIFVGSKNNKEQPTNLTYKFINLIHNNL